MYSISLKTPDQTQFPNLLVERFKVFHALSKQPYFLRSYSEADPFSETISTSWLSHFTSVTFIIELWILWKGFPFSKEEQIQQEISLNPRRILPFVRFTVHFPVTNGSLLWINYFPALFEQNIIMSCKCLLSDIDS